MIRNGLTVDVDKDLPGIVADFLYQKIVAVNTVQWASLDRMENAENGVSIPGNLTAGPYSTTLKAFPYIWDQAHRYIGCQI